MRKWTSSEDEQVIKAAKNSPDNVMSAFIVLSVTIGRSVASIVTRYYNKLNKQ